MNSVLVDTNILVYCFDRKKNLEEMLDEILQENFSLFTLKKCVDELSKIKRNDVKQFILFSDIKIVEYNTGKNTDDEILNYSLENKCIIVTEDRNLIKKAKVLKIKTISFDRGKLKFNG